MPLVLAPSLRQHLKRLSLMQPSNSIPEICELAIRLVGSSDETGELRCVTEFRVFKGDIPLGKEECEISISRATISVEIEGLSPAVGSRFGEPKRPNAVAAVKKTTQRETRESSWKVAGSVKAATNTPYHAGFEAGGSADGGRSSERQTETKDDSHHLRVRALPNLRWEVSEPNEDPLDGTYLENDDLLRLQTNPNSNRSKFSARVAVKQRHLLIKQIIRDQESSWFFSRANNNQRRLLDIFIAKSLSSGLNWRETYKGEIILSEQLHDLENEF